MESEDYHFYQGLVYLLENDVSTLGYDLTFSTEVGTPTTPKTSTRSPLGPQNQHQKPPESTRTPKTSTGTPIGPSKSALGPSQDPQTSTRTAPKNSLGHWDPPKPADQQQDPPGTP